MITAMIEVVAQRGRPDATVAHVVERSGVSRRTFYEIFDDFEDCFLAALDQSLARAGERVLGAHPPSQKWRARTRSALVALLEFIEDQPAMARLCIVETLGAGPLVHKRRTRTLAAMIAAVDEGRTESKSAATLPPMTSEGVVGGVLSVLHSRLIEQERASFLELAGPLMAMIVLPYLGPVAAQKESALAATRKEAQISGMSSDPLRDLQMRLTYRTMRVLLSIAACPGTSNREIGVAAGIDDQGQISKLLSRLEKLGLIGNSGAGQARGAPNAWELTERGAELEVLLSGHNSIRSGK
jgi:AcrR family transcriptional regulator